MDNKHTGEKDVDEDGCSSHIPKIPQQLVKDTFKSKDQEPKSERPHSLSSYSDEVLRQSMLKPTEFMLCGYELKAAALKKSQKKDEGTKKPSDEDTGSAIGIDIGTTNARVGVYENGQLKIIENEDGKKITPSIVAFTAAGEVLIGDRAKAQLIENPENTISNIQRLMGRKWSDPIVQETIKTYAFKVIDVDGKPHVKVETANGKNIFSPEEIYAMIIGKNKETAEKHLGKIVTKAVVAVPANFNDAQRRAMEDAVALSRLKLLRLINAPSAAAIAYRLYEKVEKKIVVVYSLGGGNFDVSVISIDGSNYKVLATHGDTRLGGENFDQRVLDYFINLSKNKEGRDIFTDKTAIGLLRNEIQMAKAAVIAQEQGDDFMKILIRDKFEELNEDLFESTIMSVERVLKRAGKHIKDIDEVMLVGGSSRISKIKQLVKKSFKGKELYQVVDEAVVAGAAAQASALADDKQVAPFALTDVTPLTFGVEVVGGFMSKIIRKNTNIPITKFKNFTTEYDNQTVVRIKVFEGEFPTTKDNHLLDEFKLTGIPPAPRCVPNIKVTFHLDRNGILHASAEDNKTGNRNQITINYKQKRLSPEDVDNMIENVKKLNI